MKELLKAINVKDKGKQDYQSEGGKVKLRTISLEDLDTKRWNTLAEKKNTQSFIRMTGKQPTDYAEVKAWVRSLIADTKKAPAATGAAKYA